jgi:hypothetical protein
VERLAPTLNFDARELIPVVIIPAAVLIWLATLFGLFAKRG